jgi:hypothetical protein
VGVFFIDGVFEKIRAIHYKTSSLVRLKLILKSDLANSKVGLSSSLVTELSLADAGIATTQPTLYPISFCLAYLEVPHYVSSLKITGSAQTQTTTFSQCYDFAG